MLASPLHRCSAHPWLLPLPLPVLRVRHLPHPQGHPPQRTAVCRPPSPSKKHLHRLHSFPLHFYRRFVTGGGWPAVAVPLRCPAQPTTAAIFAMDIDSRRLHHSALLLVQQIVRNLHARWIKRVDVGHLPLLHHPPPQLQRLVSRTTIGTALQRLRRSQIR